MTLRGKRTVSTALATSLALLLAGSATGTAVASGGSAGDTQAASSSWLPQTPPNWPQVVDYTKSPETTVTRGLQHYSETYDTVGGRQHVQVLAADLGDPNLRVGVVEAGDTVTDPADETVSSMAARTHAVAGVNGDYFEIHASGRPLGGVITDGRLLKSPKAGFASELGIKPDGSMVMGPENFSGTITDGAASRALTSVNTVDDVAAGGVTEVTPDLGDTPGLTGGTLVLGRQSAGGFTVESVRTGVTSVDRLAAGRSGLLGGGAGGQWLAANLHVGDTVGVAGRLSPDNDLTQMVSGVDVLVKDGKVYQDPTGTPPSGANPETAVGLSKDGRHVVTVAIDGHGGTDNAFGVTPEQAAGYMVAHGAYTAMLFDGGGSTTMAVRAPGAPQATVVNTPSDLPGNTERPVGNGIFFYSTAKAPGSAAKVTVNDGADVTTVPGGTIPLPVHALDRLGNPAAGAVHVTVVPSWLGTYADGRFTAKHTGTGLIVANDGWAVGTQRLDVTSKLATLSVSPDAPDLNGGETRQLTLTGTVKGGKAAQIPAEAASWTVTPADLGTVDAHGLFTADATDGGLAKVTATVGGATATASIAVGSVTTTIDPMSSTAEWRLSTNSTGRPATLAADPGVVPPGSTEPASLKLSYTMPAGSGVKQLVLAPNTTLKAGAGDDGQNPTGIGVWIKGNGTGIELAESYIGVDGTRTTLYPTYVTWNDWHLAIAELPAGLQFPLTISFVDFLAISPSTTTGGSLDVAGLQALYSPRPVTVPTYTAIPENPSWLSFEEDSKDFAKKGNTLLTGDDAHMLASDPGSVSSNVMDSIAGRIPALSPQARPDAAQFLGDMADDGKLPDLQYAKSTMDALGVPERDIVGNHEITQGADGENGNYSATFGDTHYSYTEGAANVVVTDNSHGSLQSSDPFQNPAGTQYPWLVQQLTDNTAKDVLVVTHMPAYDPHPAANSQFTDRWEARMYLRLVQKYQESHKDKHVIMLYGHARGFSEQVLDPEGENVSTSEGGIPQLTFADLGMPAYAPADQGGFYHYGLLRIGSDGGLQFSVEPALTSIAVTAPSQTLVRGRQLTLTATGTQTGGDNLAPLTMPIANPASHVWSSDDTRVASVDRVTGVVTAHRAGTVNVSVSSGGVTGSVRLTVG
jgi:exopolysaccharide biosynthesis protein